MCKFSVIIPVYKVELYLQKCIDSVVGQQLTDIEIILIDDGSPDMCPSMCDEYALRFSYIKVIHKKNGGLSSARNVGIDASVGEYIVFIDSDDWWNPDVNMNSVLDYVYKNPDTEMFLFNLLHYIEGEGLYKRNENGLFHCIPTDSIEHYYRHLVTAGNLQVAAWSKILKRRFLTDNDLYFKVGIKSEDNEWMIRILRCLTKVGVIDEPVYVYRYQREGSISNTIQRKNIEDLLGMIDDSILYTDTHVGERSDLELSYCSYLWFMALGLVSGCEKADQIYLKQRFKNSSKVCGYGISRKTKLSNMAFSLFGYEITMKIFEGYMCLKRTFQLNKKRIKN